MKYDWNEDINKLRGILSKKEKARKLIDEALEGAQKELLEIKQGKPPRRLVVHRDGDHVWTEWVQPAWEPPDK